MARHLRSMSSDSIVVGRIYSMQNFSNLNELPTVFSQTVSHDSHQGTDRENAMETNTSFIGSRLTETDGMVANGMSELARSTSWEVNLSDARDACVVCRRNPEDTLSADQLQFVSGSRPRSFAFIAHEEPPTTSSIRPLHSRPVYAVQSSIIHSVNRWKYFQWKIRRAWNSLFHVW